MANRMRNAANKSNGVGDPKKKKTRNTGTIQDAGTSKDEKKRKRNEKHNAKALKKVKKGKGGRKSSTPYI